MLPRPLPSVLAVSRRGPTPTMTGVQAALSRRGRGIRPTGRRRVNGPQGKGQDWLSLTVMGLALLTILAGLAGIFLP